METYIREYQEIINEPLTGINGGISENIQPQKPKQYNIYLSNQKLKIYEKGIYFSMHGAM